MTQLIDKRYAIKHSPISFFILALCLVAFIPPPQTEEVVHGRVKTQPRPALSGPALSHATAHFKIHYTLHGEDSVSSTDDNGDSLPDYVNAVAEALEFSWSEEIEQLGWRSPVPDKGEGGDTRFDVYIQDQYDLFGYVETHRTGGDNPATPYQETSAAYGYLGLDNDYTSDDFNDDLSPLDAMRTTVAHELHHAIQAAYDDNDPYEWLYEASAVWIEDEVYPDIGDAKSYLIDYMDAPDLCLLSVGRDDQDVHWYGTWILLRYISEHYGGPDTIRQLWETIARQDGLPALESTLAQQGTTLPDILVNFAAANLTKSNCPDNTPYCYAEGSNYLRPYIEGTVRVDPGEMDTLIPKDGVQQMGVDYVRIKSNNPVMVDFQGSSAAQWEVRLIGLNDDQATVSELANPGPTIIDPAQFSRLYLAIVNTTPVEFESDCGYHNYTLALADAAAFERISAPPVPQDPEPYLPPSFNTQETGFLGHGQAIDREDAPFSPLYPGYIPSDYYFSKMISYSLADLSEFEQDYAPAGKPVIGLEYIGDNDTYIYFTQSPASDENLETWVSTQGYYENDLRLVNNKPVYLVDYTDELGTFSSATFIHHNLFIVIDGTVDPIEIQHIVAGFLANNP